MRIIKTISYQIVCTLMPTLLCNILPTPAMASTETNPTKIIYVDDNTAGANDGTSWENAYNFLQDALANANDSDEPVEIRVASGTYTPDKGANQIPGDREATFQLINGVTIKGGYAGVDANDPNTRDIELYETILSGDFLDNDGAPYDPEEQNFYENVINRQHMKENAFHVVTASGTDNSAVIDGCILTRGNDDRMETIFINTSIIVTNIGYGAGLYNSEGSPTVNNCSFRDNLANAGGSGMYNENNSKPILTNCTFYNNYNDGIFNGESEPNLINCMFENNQNSGMVNRQSNPTLLNCRFIKNLAVGGGGMHNFNESNPTLRNCTFNENSALTGGAMLNKGSSPNLKNCLFINNSANPEGGHGGAISNTDSNVILTNCTFDLNTAQGGNSLACESSAQHFPSSLEIVNCIFWGGANEIWNNDSSVINISYSNIQSGQDGVYDPGEAVIWGQGNIDEDPLFAASGYWADANDPNAVWVDGDYHLKSEYGRWNPITQTWVVDDVTSPCIDAGDPNTPVGDEPFPNGVIINMGVYGGTADASKSTSDIPATVNVNDSDNGGQVTLKQGQILAVTLESNPSTGYSWAPVEKQDSILEQFGDSLYFPAEQEDGIVGGGGWEIFYFKSISIGQEILELIYRRPWETDVEPAKTFSIEVTVN